MRLGWFFMPDFKQVSKSKRSPWRRSISIVVGLAIIVGVAFGVRHITSNTQPAGGGSAGHAAPSAVPVTAAVATRQNVPDIVSAIGTVQSIDSVAIQPRVTGTIQKIEFTPGQNVKEGQELFVIDPRPYQAALDQAKAQLAHDQGVLAEAQMDLQRYQTLQQQKSIAAQQAQDQVYVVQQAQGTVQLDQANIEAAQLNLNYTRITAPVSGRAGTLLVDLGNLVGPPSGASASNASSTSASTSTISSSMQATSSSTLVYITQLQPIYVSFAVAQGFLGQIKTNQAKGALEVRAYSQAGKLIEKGKLTVIDNQVNTNAGTVTMQATFANADESLWPGEFVRVELVVATRQNVVTVPTQAVMAGPDGSYVYVVGIDSRVKRVAVQVTARQGAIAVIGKGLSGGEKVVTDGQYRLDNGTTVAVQQTTVPATPETKAQAD
jgi:membrane fusion protein, multidrug efflux system